MAERSRAHAALGRTVRDIRKKHGVSQEELGHRAGVDRTYVGGIERGEKNPTFETFGRLAKGLGVPPSKLLARAEALDRSG